ncbi:alpha-ribazole-5'-phosphate phosphatase [Klebsiella grimontii]|uniref:Alpha-ribazole-5'-phosphate phosphatase n=1 Tax=Klebsiella grimontii TaxID=2058152 RepID=A0A7H4P7X1_9ENTR|nr:alpha-ribazole-5'-phosphate phosphatase [Klebsiella grimontii]
MKLWLVRHGETEANVAGLYSGHAPTALTERGIRQAQTLESGCRPFLFSACFAVNLSAPSVRPACCLATVTSLASPLPSSMKCSSATGKCATIAIYSMKMRKTTPRGAPDWQHAAPTNGEGFQAFAERVSGFTAALPQHRELSHLLIVGHQGVLSLLIAQLLNMPDSAMWHFPIEHGAWSLVDLQPDFTTLRVLNSRAVWLAEEELRADH